MFGLIKRSTHAAVVADLRSQIDDLLASDKSRAQVNAGLLRQIETLRTNLMEADKRNTELHEAVAKERREARVIGAALSEVIAERDALRSEVAALKPEVERARARRAKATANLKNQRRAA